jgi:hypothetical protein
MELDNFTYAHQNFHKKPTSQRSILEDAVGPFLPYLGKCVPFLGYTMAILRSLILTINY